MKHRAVESVQTLTTPLISSHSLTIEVLCKLWSNKQNKSKVVNVDTHIHTHTHTHTNTHTNTHTHIHTQTHTQTHTHTYTHTLHSLLCKGKFSRRQSGGRGR